MIAEGLAEPYFAQAPDARATETGAIFELALAAHGQLRWPIARYPREPPRTSLLKLPLQALWNPMSTRIAIDCLKCGHSASVSEENLPFYGLERGVPCLAIKTACLQKMRQ